MDTKDLRGLMEAYSEVYAPQEEIEEAERPVYGRGGGLRRTQTALQVLGKHATARDKKKLHNIPKGGTTIGTGDSGKLMSGEYDRGKGSKAARRAAALKSEEFQLWVDSLVEEGYDLSEYTWDEMVDIYEEEGSYGETPKAYSAASKTKMTAKRKPFLKAMLRRTNPAERKDAYGSPRKGMTAADREEARAGAAHGSPRGHDYPSQGPGGVTKNPKKLRKQKAMGEFAKEEFDIFDIVLEFLQVEGYVETLEEAEWLMANELDAEDIEAILEAEGSYGKTPKAREAMGKLAIARREKPASEYSQKGEKTKKVKEIEKHTRRIDNGPNVGNRGKRSTPPRYSAGRGKMDQDARDYGRADSAEYGYGTHGSGSVTKNPKKLRKQKAIGEID